MTAIIATFSRHIIPPRIHAGNSQYLHRDYGAI
jgi:hypothetical protein